jgi:hypothetical protein
MGTQLLHPKAFAYASLNTNRSLILKVIKDVFLLLPALEMPSH